MADATPRMINTERPSSNFADTTPRRLQFGHCRCLSSDEPNSYRMVAQSSFRVSRPMYPMRAVPFERDTYLSVMFGSSLSLPRSVMKREAKGEQLRKQRTPSMSCQLHVPFLFHRKEPFLSHNEVIKHPDAQHLTRLHQPPCDGQIFWTGFQRS